MADNNQNNPPQQPGWQDNQPTAPIGQPPAQQPPFPPSQPPGGYQPPANSYQQPPGAYPQQPQQPANYPQQPGTYPQPGAYPQQPGGYPQPGAYPQQPGGYPQQGAYHQPPMTPPAQKSNVGKTIGIIVGALVLLGIIAALTWFFLRPQTPGTPTTTAAASAPSTSKPSASTATKTTAPATTKSTPSAPASTSGGSTSLSNLPKKVGDYQLFGEPTADGGVYMSGEKMMTIAAIPQHDMDGIKSTLTEPEQGDGFICGKLLGSAFLACYIQQSTGAIQVMPFYDGATIADTKAFTQQLLAALR